jgi:hypothetical protein
MHQVSKILFCHETLHVSGVFCAHHQELSAVHVAIGMFHVGYVAAVPADSHSPECVIPDYVLIKFGPPDDEHLLLETCRGIK